MQKGTTESKEKDSNTSRALSDRKSIVSSSIIFQILPMFTAESES